MTTRYFHASRHERGSNSRKHSSAIATIAHECWAHTCFKRHDMATRSPHYRILDRVPCRKLSHTAQMCDTVKGLEQISVVWVADPGGCSLHRQRGTISSVDLGNPSSTTTTIAKVAHGHDGTQPTRTEGLRFQTTMLAWPGQMRGVFSWAGFTNRALVNSPEGGRPLDTSSVTLGHRVVLAGVPGCHRSTLSSGPCQIW